MRNNTESCVLERTTSTEYCPDMPGRSPLAAKLGKRVQPRNAETCPETHVWVLKARTGRIWCQIGARVLRPLKAFKRLYRLYRGAFPLELKIVKIDPPGLTTTLFDLRIGSGGFV